MKIALLFLTVFSIQGCTLLGRQPIEVPEQGSAMQSDELKTPIAVSVRKAYQELNTLHVTTRLDILSDITTDQAVVGIVGLKDGIEITNNFVKISSLSNKEELKAGQSLSIPLEIPADGITEFQVRCLWGQDASPTIALLDRNNLSRARLARQDSPHLLDPNNVFTQKQQDPVAKIISKSAISEQPKQNKSLKNVTLGIAETREKETSCKNKPCDILYTVVAELENKGSSKINRAKIAVGLYWANAGAIPAVPADGAKLRDTEQELTLKDLHLTPGQKKRLEVKIDQPVPPVRGGGFVPNIRLLSVAR
jgi:hypothetical protein